jgi:hypothetical protein
MPEASWRSAGGNGRQWPEVPSGGGFGSLPAAVAGAGKAVRCEGRRPGPNVGRMPAVQQQGGSPESGWHIQGGVRCQPRPRAMDTRAEGGDAVRHVPELAGKGNLTNNQNA